MKSKMRVSAAVMAVLLAAAGIGALVMYAKGAEERAFAGRETVSVLRVTESVPAGTKAADIEDKVERVKLPRAAVPKNIVTDVDDLGGKVTTASLVPGEVLVGARFTGSPTLKGSGAIEVPNGLQELTIELSSARVVGGAVQPGDLVGVLASYEGEKITNFAVNKALVLAVGGGLAGSDAATGGVVQVRLALESEAVERVVNASEFGKVWLSRQNNGAKTARKVIDPGAVVK
jgi:pilus assembly protein CpaB